MLHAPSTKFHAVSTVLTNGHDGNLAKGQFAVAINKAAPGKGKVVVDNFDGMSKQDKIALEVGIANTPNKKRTVEVPYKSTGFFSIGDITNIKSYTPSNVKLKVDHFEVGFDGSDETTALYIPEGKSAVMDIVLYGEVASMFFGTEKHVISVRAHRAEGETMQEVVRRLVKEINETSVPTATGWASTTDVFSQFIEVGVIDSEMVATVGNTFTFSSITVPNNGDSNALADIQAQYPDYQVVQTGRDGANGTTTYTIMHPSGDVIADYVYTVVDTNIPGCEDCLAGYSLIEGGLVYHVSLEDDGADETGIVQAIPNAVVASAIKFGNQDGRGTYSVVLTASLTDLEKETFLTANPTAEFTYRGRTQDVCTSTTEVKYTWVAGEECVATTQDFTILLKDNECGESRLEELQLAYPDLVITEVVGSSAGCKRKYQTTVPTNIVCEQCSDIFLQPFYAEAPLPFQGTFTWSSTPITYSETAHMGIFIKGKPYYMYPEGYEDDFIPFVETSLKIRSVSFGQREDDIINYTGAQYDVDRELAKVVQYEYAQDVKNLSHSLFGAEDEGDLWGTNRRIFKKNLFAKANLSQDRILKYGQRIIKYVVQYQDNGLSQGFASRSNVTHEFGIMVQEGKHQAIELILNKLAAKVGLPAVTTTV